MNNKIYPAFYFFIIFNCVSTQLSVTVLVIPEKQVTILPNPAGEKESILDEYGEFVENTTKEPPFFSSESKDSNEYFRVIISSDSYKVRQIRATNLFLRKPDPGGDSLMTEELNKYDLI